MVSGVLAVVVSFKFHQNRLSGYKAVRGRNLAHLITYANSLYNSLPPEGSRALFLFASFSFFLLTLPISYLPEYAHSVSRPDVVGGD